MTSGIVLSGTSYHGADAIQEIVNEAEARGFKKAFACSDPNLIKFNVTCRVTKVLEGAGLVYEIYSGIKPNSTIENVQTRVAAFKASGANCIITIGDGSSIDTSKAIGVIVANPEFKDVGGLESVTPTENPCVPIIAVPTAAGTATEVTISYVIMDVEKKRKFVCVDTHDIPAVAVVDPEMMSSMPKGLTAATSTDALTRAIEGYTTRGTREVTDMFNLKAVEVIARSLRGAVESKPEDRESMTLGQYLTGMGSSNCGLGTVHSMVHGLSILYDTPHGVANAIILPAVTKYNTPCIGAKSKDVAAAMGVEGVENITQGEYRRATVGVAKRLPADVGIPADLKEVVKPEDVDFLSRSAMDNTCHLDNLKDPSSEDTKNLYLSLM